MAMTRTHPLMSKAGDLTRDELLELTRWEGLVGISHGDERAALQLAAEGLVTVSLVAGQPHVTPAAS